LLSTLSPVDYSSGPKTRYGVWLELTPVELSSTRHHQLLLAHFKSGLIEPIAAA